MDFYTDTAQTLLKAICTIRKPPDFVKTSSIIEKGSIPDRLFALPEKRAFPIADPAGTYVSFGYWLFNNNQMGDREKQASKENLVKAAQFFGITDDIIALAKSYANIKKDIQEKKASVNYGLSETKEFPLHTRDHVHQAVETFPLVCSKYAVPERVKIASMIMNKAQKHRIPVQTQIIIKYANVPNRTCHSELTAANIASRALYVEDLQAQQLMNKLAHGLIGNINGQNTLYKLASVLERLDESMGLNKLYARNQIHDPIDTIFNMKKSAALLKISEMPIHIGSNKDLYDIADLANISIDFWDEIFGEDFVSAIQSPQGTVDINKLATILPTLPLPEQDILARYLSQHYATENAQ